MTEAFASAVAVTVPILALAAGAEARAVRERVRQPNEEWEQALAAYSQARELDANQSHADALRYFVNMPQAPKMVVVERIAAIAGALVWLAVFVLLTVDELRCLVWLGDGAHPGDSGLATFSVVTTGLALGALIVSPALYLLFPLLLTVDLVPRGLREKVGPSLRTIGWRDLLRHMAEDFDQAVEHAGQEAEQHRKQPEEKDG